MAAPAVRGQASTLLLAVMCMTERVARALQTMPATTEVTVAGDIRQREDDDNAGAVEE